MNKSLILNEIKSHLGFTKDADFARFLGIQTNTLANWHKRNTYDAKLLITKCESINPDYIMTGDGGMFRAVKIQGDPDFDFGLSKFSTKPIPLVNISAIAGFGSDDFSIKENEVEDFYVVPEFGSIDFMIRVHGDSMLPKFTGGDIIACRKINEKQFIQWNKCHVIATMSQGILIKRILKSELENCIQAVSENKNYPPFDISRDEIKGIALVIGTIHME